MLPSTIYKGTLLNFTETLSSYPASEGYQLKYALINATRKIVLASSASGDNHVINIESAKQGAWDFGNYTYQKYVVKTGASTVLLKTGKTKIEPFFESEENYDARSFWQKLLDAIDALLLDRSASLDLEYSFKGKSLRSMTLEELFTARKICAYQVSLEETQAKIDAGEETGGRLFFGFEQ